MKKYQKIAILILFISLCFICNVYATTSDELDEEAIFQSIKWAAGENFSPPFARNDAIEENISTATGNLSLTQVDLVLEGKNGHDLVIKREYSNQNTCDLIWAKRKPELTTLNDKPAYLYNGSNGLSYYIVFNSEIEMLEEAPDRIEDIAPPHYYYDRYSIYEGQTCYLYEKILENWGRITLTRDKNIPPVYPSTTIYTDSQITPRTMFYNIGNGWRLSLPYLQSFGEYLKDDRYPYCSYGEFYDGQGGIYTYWQDGYRRMNIFSAYRNGYTGQFINGMPYSRTVTDKSGRTMHFLSSGHIGAIDDQYGNRILFEYDAYGNLIKITDTLGREVLIAYSNGCISSISVGDKIITYSVEELGNHQSVLTTTDAEGNQTRYEAVKKEPAYATRYDAYDDEYDSDDSVYYVETYIYTRKSVSYDITKITYPTGASTHYTYGKAHPYYGEGLLIYGDPCFGKWTKYKIQMRKDISEGNTYNHNTYTYNCTYNGKYLEGIDGSFLYGDNRNYYENYTYTGTIARVADGYEEVHTYNLYGKEISIIQTGNDGCKSETQYSYKDIRGACGKNDSECPPSMVKRIEYNHTNPALRIATVQEYEYDQKLNMLKETLRDYVAEYTYDPTYSYMLTKTYKRDDANVISIENTLTADSKGIEWSRVKENGVLKNETKYQYDAYGNIIAVYNYPGDGTEIINRSTYTYYPDQAHTVYNYTENVTDIDGLNPQTIGEEYSFDRYGNLSSYKDGNQNITTYSYDRLNRKTGEYYPDGTNKTYTYNMQENYIIIKDENGNRTKMQYDGLGRDKAVYSLNPDTQAWIYRAQYTYDPMSRKQTEAVTQKSSSTGTIEEKLITTYAYNTAGKKLSQTTRDIAGNLISKATYTYDEAIEDTINGVDGIYSRTTLQAQGDSSITPAPAKQYYDQWGRLVKQETEHNKEGAPKTYTTTYKYDYVGNKISVKDARAYDENRINDTVVFEYDHEGRITRETNMMGKSTFTVYDNLGRIKSKSDYRDRYTHYTYDKLGRLIQTEAPFQEKQTTKTLYYYDKNGNVTKTMQQANLPKKATAFTRTENTYDCRNRLVKIAQYDTDGSATYTQYHYDATGNKTKMFTGLSSTINTTTETGPDMDFAVTRYHYNYLNQMIRMTDPLGQQINYTYDMMGNLINQIDRMDAVTTYTYNGLGKLLNKAVTHDGVTDEVSYTYDLIGNRKTMTDTTGTTYYTYDDLSRLIEERSPGNITKQYAYDAADNRTSFKLKQDQDTQINTTYTYNKLNWLQQVTENGQVTATYRYEDNGNRVELICPDGSTTSYTYNQANRLTTLTNQKDGTILSQYTYTYYLDGNQASKTDTNGQTTYVYDGLGRLKTVTEPDTAITYAYDDYNNRESMMVAGGANTTYTYDKNNRLLSETKTTNDGTEITRYSYDDNGNQRWKARETTQSASGQAASFNSYVAGTTPQEDVELFEYDGFNQLIKSITGDQTIAYSYNGDGIRINKNINGAVTTHVWDGGNIVLELDDMDNIAGKYIRGINLIAAEVAGIRSYYLYNGHGDVVQLLGVDGSIRKAYDYDAFGNEKDIDINDPNPFRYCGEYFDKETGTYYLRARYYDPWIGRFITEDSYRGDIRDPLSLNLYTYAHSNPIIYIDPSGHIPIPMPIMEKAIDLLSQYGNQAWAWISQISSQLSQLSPDQFVQAYEIAKESGQKLGQSIQEKLGGGSGNQDPNKWNNRWKTVRESSKASKTVDKLSNDLKKVYDQAIEGLAKGDHRGLRVHRLSNGNLAADLKGIGGGRGQGRIIYKVADGVIEVVEVTIKHYKK